MVVSIKKYNKNINKKCTKTKKMYGGAGPAGNYENLHLYSGIYSDPQSSSPFEDIYYSNPYNDGLPTINHIYSTVNNNPSHQDTTLNLQTQKTKVGSKNIYNTFESSSILINFANFFIDNNLAEKFVAMENEYLLDEFIFNEEFMRKNIIGESNKISFNDFKNNYYKNSKFINDLKQILKNKIYNQQNTEKFIKLNEKYFIINYLLDSNKTNNNDSNFSKMPRRLARILKCKIDNNNDDLKKFIDTKFSDDNEYNKDNNIIKKILNGMSNEEIETSIQSAFTEYTTYTS